jgi:HSP20 family protein
MNIVRFEPFHDLSSLSSLSALQNRFDRFFGEALARPTNSEEEPLRASWMPTIDVHENEQAITLRAELAGLTEDDVELTVDKGRMTLQGEKKLDKEDTDGEYRRIESRYGSFYRSFPLPDAVDQEKIEASFSNGVLTVVLTKSEAAKPKKIALKIN